MVPYSIEYIIVATEIVTIAFLASLKAVLWQEKMERKINDAAYKVETKDLKTRARAHVESISKQLLGTVETKNSGQTAIEIFNEPWNSSMAAKPNSELKETQNVLLRIPQNSNSLQSGSKREEPKADVKKQTDSPQECLHFFQYLQSLPEGSEIPDECCSCQKIIDCYST